jgi:hypothetical protein
MIESPQGFIVAEECRKAASQNGYRRAFGQQDGWARFGSTTASGEILLAATGAAGPWFLAVDHPGVIAEFTAAGADMQGPGTARYLFENLGALYAALERVYALSISLPDAPLQSFIAKTKDLPQSTEVERLVVQRIGQNLFRDGLMAYWGGRCPLTGISDPELLRASHIKPWARCETDAERLDVHNGLLLSALWDAAFDRGLVTFDDDGQPQFSPALSDAARAELRWTAGLQLAPGQKRNLAWHRKHAFGRVTPDQSSNQDSSASAD